MTVAELNEYYYLEQAIKLHREDIARIEARLCGSAAFDTSGASKNPTPQNRVENAYIQLTELRSVLESKVAAYEAQKLRVERFIAHIRDPLVVLIATKRVLERKTWAVVAEEIGGGNTPESVRKELYRYIERWG